MKQRGTSLLLFLLLGLLAPATSLFMMSGGDFEIYADSFTVIEGDQVSGGSFLLTQTGDSISTTSSTNATFELRGGFEAQEKGVLSFTLSSSTLNFSSLSSTTLAVATTTLRVSTDSETGYAVSLTQSGPLANGGDTIDPVADGDVTIGSEEYGIRTSGADALQSGAVPIAGSVGIASAVGEVTARETDIGFYIAVSPSTPAGVYSHTVTFSVTVNP